MTIQLSKWSIICESCWSLNRADHDSEAGVDLPTCVQIMMRIWRCRWLHSLNVSAQQLYMQSKLVPCRQNQCLYWINVQWRNLSIYLCFDWSEVAFWRLNLRSASMDIGERCKRTGMTYTRSHSMALFTSLEVWRQNNQAICSRALIDDNFPTNFTHSKLHTWTKDIALRNFWGVTYHCRAK